MEEELHGVEIHDMQHPVPFAIEDEYACDWNAEEHVVLEKARQKEEEGELAALEERRQEAEEAPQRAG